MGNEHSIQINLLQHYIYCPRQWGLMVMDNEWGENHFVALGNIVHKKVDDPFFNEKRKEKYVSRSVPLYSDKYGLNGIADVVEFTASPQGAYVDTLKGNYKLTVVEYKRGKPRVKGEINYADKIQLTAQMMCINDMFSTECEGYIFYDTIGRKIKHNDFEAVKGDVLLILGEIEYYTQLKSIPQKSKNCRCKGCSLFDICLPKVKADTDFKKSIEKTWRNICEETT